MEKATKISIADAGLLGCCAGAVILFRDSIEALMDAPFSRIFGKYLTQRGVPVRTAVLLFCAFCGFLLLRVILNRLSPEGSRTVTYVLLSASLICFALICKEQTLRRDDYWEIYDAREMGFPGFIVTEFTLYNGRYFSLFLKSLYNFFDAVPYINTLLFLNILLLCVGWYRIFSIIIRTYFACSNPIVVSVCAGIIGGAGTVFVAANLWEVWFWGGGTFIYGVGITLLIHILASLLQIMTEQKSGGLAAFLIFCACGCSELITASCCLFTAAFCLCMRFRNKTLLRLMLWSWLCCLFVLCFSGDLGSAADFNGQHPENFLALLSLIFSVFSKSFTESVTKIAVFGWSRGEYLLSFVLMFFLLGTQVKNLRFQKRILLKAVLSCLLTAVFCLMVNTVIGFIPPRVISIPLTWVYLSLALCAFVGGSMVFRENKMVLPVCSLVVFLAVGHFYSENITFLKDLGKAWAYRDTQLNSVKDKTGVVNTCYFPVPGSGTPDLSEDPTYGINLVTAKYYEISVLTASEACPPFGSFAEEGVVK